MLKMYKKINLHIWQCSFTCNVKVTPLFTLCIPCHIVVSDGILILSNCSESGYLEESSYYFSNKNGINI